MYKFILLLFISLLYGCKNSSITNDEVTLNKNGDTVEVIKKYPSQKIKEIINYRSNKPFDNIGFYENGDTIKQPDVIFTEADSTMFAFIPLNKGIRFANIFLGMDSIKWEQPYYLAIHDSVCERLTDLTRSVNFRLRYELITDGEFVGVFQCTLDSALALKYFPFKTKLKQEMPEPTPKVTLRRG